MKKIEAIIRPERLAIVRSALESAGYPGLTISEVEGHGKQKGALQRWQGESYRVNYLPKIRIEIVCSENEMERIIYTIVDSAQTGELGDGKIFISDIHEVIRIRTRERGLEALA